MGLGLTQRIENRKGDTARPLISGQKRLGALAFGALRLLIRICLETTMCHAVRVPRLQEEAPQAAQSAVLLPSDV